MLPLLIRYRSYDFMIPVSTKVSAEYHQSVYRNYPHAGLIIRAGTFSGGRQEEGSKASRPRKREGIGKDLLSCFHSKC